MAHAAGWLAYAVGKSDAAYNGYLNDAKNYFKPGVPWSMSWSEKRPAVAVSQLKLQNIYIRLLYQCFLG